MAELLGRLLTDLGERSSADAAAQCSRCGYCEQSCPTYVATGRESFSPRGRTQLVRMLLEGRLEDAAGAEEALSTCLLCGACQTICYAKVPVPDLALEGRRLLRGKSSLAVRWLNRLLIERPGTLRMMLKVGYALKRWGVARLARPILRVLSWNVLAAMDEHVGAAPAELFDDLIPALRADGEGDAWNYFAPCGPRYLLPAVATATWNNLSRLCGQGRFIDNACCGLLAFNYGDAEDARRLAKQNIEKAEAAGAAPIVGDCSSCVAFLKTYPQLFIGDEVWRLRAEKFSARVRDVIEVYGERAASLVPGGDEAGPIAYHDSCRALNGQGISAPPRAALDAVAPGKSCALAGAGECCGGAGAFAFTHESLSDDILRRKIGSAAAAHARVIVTSSTSCLVQLARGLRKYYPDARVQHLSEFIADRQGEPHGA